MISNLMFICYYNVEKYLFPNTMPTEPTKKGKMNARSEDEKRTEQYNNILTLILVIHLKHNCFWNECEFLCFLNVVC